MRRTGLLLILILGLAILIVAFGIGWADWWTFTNRETVVRVLLGTLAIVVVFLVTLGILNKGENRWIAFLFVAVLLFGFSVFAITSVGVFGVPVGLILLRFYI